MARTVTVSARDAPPVAADQVRVDQAGGLHQRVHGRGADETEASLAQRLRERSRLRRDRRDLGRRRGSGSCAGRNPDPAPPARRRHGGRWWPARCDGSPGSWPGCGRSRGPPSARPGPRRSSRPPGRRRTRGTPPGTGRACSGSWTTRAPPGTPRDSASRRGHSHLGQGLPTRCRGSRAWSRAGSPRDSGRRRPRPRRAPVIPGLCASPRRGPGSSRSRPRSGRCPRRAGRPRGRPCRPASRRTRSDHRRPAEVRRWTGRRAAGPGAGVDHLGRDRRHLLRTAPTVGADGIDARRGERRDRVGGPYAHHGAQVGVEAERGQDGEVRHHLAGGGDGRLDLGRSLIVSISTRSIPPPAARGAARRRSPAPGRGPWCPAAPSARPWGPRHLRPGRRGRRPPHGRSGRRPR